jgi:TonB family protein
MRALWFIAFFAGLGVSLSSGQQSDFSSSPLVPDSQPARVKVFSVGPGVTTPELLPLNVTDISTEECKKKVDGKVVLSAIVDMTGRPHYLSLLNANKRELEPLAFQIVTADRFSPGTYNGAPVLVAVSVEVDLQACHKKTEDTTGKKAIQLRLRSQPMQTLKALSLSHPPEEDVLAAVNSFWMGSMGSDNDAVPVFRVGGEVSAPVVLNSPTARFSDEARRTRTQGVCMLALIVDTNGIPQNVHVVQSLGMGMDEKAIEAVSRYRFKPAMKDGKPVPVMVNIEVNFRLY